MGEMKPTTELQAQFSIAGAEPAAWEQARERLGEAEVYWLSTVRPDFQPDPLAILMKIPGV